MARPGRPPKYQYYPRGGLVVVDPAKLRYWRDAREMTRQELADAARVSVHSIGHYELGRPCPSQDTFRRLYQALGVGPEELMAKNGRYIAPDPDPNFED